MPVGNHTVRNGSASIPTRTYRGDFATIHLKQDDEYYMVVPTLIERLRNELTLVTIYTTINRAGVVFLWPAPRPNSDGRGPGDTWHRSAHEPAAEAMKRLTRVSANKDLGAYEIAYSDNPMPENDPVWPDLPFDRAAASRLRKAGALRQGLRASRHQDAARAVMLGALPYAAIVAADFEFEFGGCDGNLPRPVCMVAKELRSGREWRIWRGEFGSAAAVLDRARYAVRRLRR